MQILPSTEIQKKFQGEWTHPSSICLLTLSHETPSSVLALRTPLPAPHPFSWSFQIQQSSHSSPNQCHSLLPLCFLQVTRAMWGSINTFKQGWPGKRLKKVPSQRILRKSEAQNLVALFQDEWRAESVQTSRRPGDHLDPCHSSWTSA